MDGESLAALRDAALIYVGYSAGSVVALARAGLGSRVVAGFEGWMVDDDLRAALDECRLADRQRQPTGRLSAPTPRPPCPWW